MKELKLVLYLNAIFTEILATTEFIGCISFFWISPLISVGMASNCMLLILSMFGLCITQDIDLFIDHMNNARYLRELDMARFHFFISNNIFQEVTKRKGFGLLAASSIRYRRPIPVFSSYRIDTKIVYWDDKNFYLEHQFITLSDGFIRAIVYGKQHVTGVNVIELMAIMTENNSISEVPPDVNHWLQSLEISSLTLRQKNE